MCQTTHLSLKIFPNGTSCGIFFIDSPIFNRWIFNGVLNIFWWKDSISTAYSGIGGIHWELNRYGRRRRWRWRRHTLNLYYYRNSFFIQFCMYEFLSTNLNIVICMKKPYEFVYMNLYILICICKISRSFRPLYLLMFFLHLPTVHTFST